MIAGWLSTLAPAAHALLDGPAAGLPDIPPFAELEKSGAVIGEIRINAQNIFDDNDPAEDKWLFRLANRLHIQTRPEVIARILLFKRGDKVSVQRLEETERLLRANRTLYDAQIKPVAYHDGVVDLEVMTRDTWTLDIAGNFSRSGGNNKTSIGLKDYNVMGTGLKLGFSRLSDVDRSGTEFEIGYQQAFDGWTALNFTRGRYDDGKRTAASVIRPFYSLDTRWAAGAAWNDEDRIDSIYNAGDVVSQYRHRQRNGEVSAGWSRGLIDHWTWRYSAGAVYRDDIYRAEPGKTLLWPLPVDQDVRGPFVRLEVIQDQFVKLRNRDQIERSEFFSLGFNGRFQVTRALAGWGSTRSAWLYSANMSNGYTFGDSQTLLAAASFERRLASTGAIITQSGGVMRYYMPQGPRTLFFASASADRLSRGGGAADMLLLGGNNGLRGYPLRYQAGERRAIFSVEERAYTDWYPFHLFRVGGAVFFDYGRAWGGANQNQIENGWLADAGIGLRLSVDRASFANVLHADIALPINRPRDVKPVQFLVRTELTF